MRVRALVGLVMMLAACEPTGPASRAVADAGAVDVVLPAPTPGDGALLIRVAGGPVDSVTAVGAYTIYEGSPLPAERRFIVRGPVHAGAVARLWVPNRAALGAYGVTVEQAADRATHTARTPDAYPATLTPE